MIREVAQRAGVSIGTVSRVINGNATVAAELRERVESAIAELGYQPNVFARGLRGGRTQSLGLVIPDVSNPFFSALVLEIEQAASQAGYSVILGNSMESQKAERTYIRALLSRQVDGLLIAPTARTRTFAEPQRTVPVVALGRALRDIPSILIDERGGARQAVDYLVSLGHRDIACIAGPSGLEAAVERHRGYLDAAAAHLASLGRDPLSRVRFTPFDTENGYKAALELLALPLRPTAIFASNDQQAIGALRAANDLGLRVPDDVSIIGFDNIPLTNLMTPRLSTIAMGTVGQEGVELLLSLIAGRPAAYKDRLPTSLVIRESCGAPNVQTVKARIRRR